MSAVTLNEIKESIATASKIVVLQADNPDGDSLGSSLALEEILSDAGKSVTMYCGVSMPSYLSYLPGWDRVTNELPRDFDLSIIVDTSAWSLFENLQKLPAAKRLSQQPCIVLDHHDVECSIPAATLVYNQPVVATGELIYELSQQLKWQRNDSASNMIAASILSDSLGLTSEATSARTIHIIAELVEQGVNLAELEAKRRDNMRKSPELVHYKGQLLQRVEYADDGHIAMVTIPWVEIERYSPSYNPSMLVLDDMRLTDKVQVAIAFKTYKDGKVTGKIRCNYGVGIAGKLAEHFGGGGHAYAAGFKVTSGQPFDKIKAECVAKASTLLKTPS